MKAYIHGSHHNADPVGAPRSCSPTATHDQRGPFAECARQSSPSGALQATLFVSVMVPALLLWGLSLALGVQISVWVTPRPAPALHPRVTALPAKPVLDSQTALRGRAVFEGTCAACHSSSGLGKQGLGKSLVHSDFIADRGDAAIVSFLLLGRDVNDPLNTTKIPMPPKGGNATLTDADLNAVVAYLRGLQDPRRMPELPTWVPPVAVPATEAEKAAALAAAGGDAELAGFIANGTKIFNTTCIACHGAGGVGIKGNGKTLMNNEFIKSQNEDSLLAFIKRGRDPSDPKNTTGIAMPPKGGNPALTEDNLLDVIAYLRTLQNGAPAAAGVK